MSEGQWWATPRESYEQRWQMKEGGIREASTLHLAKHVVAFNGN
jgi:hypothetical protein